MADIQYVNIGPGPNDGVGDPLRTAFEKINVNFLAVNTELGNLSVSVTGDNVNASTAISTASIIKTGANATGNIGSSTNFFNRVFATASTALYADLAERYVADDEYEPGTVVSFGGRNEVTLCTIDGDTAVAGVVSSKPAYEMNASLTGENVCVVALTRRVPCKVKGPVRKGSLMVAAGDGYARAEKAPAPGTIVGKSLENFNGEFGVIEVVVGRF